MNTLIGVTLALVSAFSWASATILVRVGLRNLSPIGANIFRLYTAGAIFLLTFSLTGNLSAFKLPPMLLFLAFISGIFGFVIGDYFYFNALKRMGVSRTVPITSTYPLWTILWAVLFLGKGVKPQVVIGALLVVVAIIIVKRAEEKENADRKGFLFAFLAPILWSVAIVIMQYLTAYIPNLQLAGLRMIFGAAGISVFLPRYGGEVAGMRPKEALSLAGASLLGLVIGQYLFVYSVALVGASIAAPVSAINPIIASLLAVLFLKERPSRRILEGLLLAVAGVILISTA
ncbi:DMT family transporter [Thermococcus sp.]|uniref:DMT family transporter n=1 Tax=Thermococcus sp. TaxID=35749 RepID=UPI0026262825|nr:DMT family transporter [Thermococcus sp.]